MTFAGMSTGNPDGIRSFPERGQNEFRTHPSGTGEPDNPYIRRVFQPADAGKVCCTITAPVAEKTYNFYIFVRHNFILLYTTSSRANICEKI
jgi:hypothetical protein